MWLNGPATQPHFDAPQKTPSTRDEALLSTGASWLLLSRLHLQTPRHLSLALGKAGEEARGCVQAGSQRAGDPRGTGLSGSLLAAGVPPRSRQQAGQRDGTRGHPVPPRPGHRVRAAALPWQLGTSRQACEGDVRMRARAEREGPVAF